MIDWLVAALISLTLNVVAYLIQPKPKQKAPDAIRELDVPTAEADKPITVIFGSELIKSPNALWTGRKSMRQYEIDAE